MAFQPIVDLDAGGSVFAYEALVRGASGESAQSILDQVPDDEFYAFDAACRTRAVEMAASFGIRCGLSLNVAGGAICDRRFGLHATLRAAHRAGWPVGRLIFEMTEHERVMDIPRLKRWFAACRNRGASVAIDDFGSAYSGLNLLLMLRPDLVKIDMGLVRGIDSDPGRQALVNGVMEACRSFGSSLIAEGIETEDEMRTLRQLGVGLMQGYYFARPGVASLPTIARPLHLDAPNSPPRGGSGSWTR